MDYWRRERIGAATGAVAAVLMTVAMLIPGSFPAPGASSEAIRQFLLDKRAEILGATFLFGVASIFALWFLGSLRSTLRRAEGGAGRVAGVAYAGGLGVLAITFLNLVLLAAPVYGIAQEPDATLNAALFRMSNVAGVFSYFPVIVLIGATTLVAIRTGLLPRWLVGLGMAGAALNALGTFSLWVDSGTFAVGGTTSSLVPFAATAIWVAATSTVLAAKFGASLEIGVARRRIGDVIRPEAVVRERRRQVMGG